MEISEIFKKQIIQSLPDGSELLIVNADRTIDGMIPWPCKLYNVKLFDSIFKMGQKGDRITVRTKHNQKFKIHFKYLSTPSIEVAKKLLDIPQ